MYGVGVGERLHPVGCLVVDEAEVDLLALVDLHRHLRPRRRCCNGTPRAGWGRCSGATARRRPSSTTGSRPPLERAARRRAGRGARPVTATSAATERSASRRMIGQSGIDRPGERSGPAHELWSVETLGDRVERRRRSRPTQLVDRRERRGLGAQRREIAEQQRQLALLVERGGQLGGAAHVDVPAPVVVGDVLEMAVAQRAPRPPTSRPSPGGPGTRRRCRRRAPASRGSTRAARRTSRAPRPRRSARRLRRSSCTTRSPTTHWPEVLVGRADDHDLLDPGVGARRPRPPRPARRRPRSRPWATPRRRARASASSSERELAPAARGSCRRSTCSRATGRCGTTRSRGRSRRRGGWRLRSAVCMTESSDAPRAPPTSMPSAVTCDGTGEVVAEQLVGAVEQVNLHDALAITSRMSTP